MDQIMEFAEDPERDEVEPTEGDASIPMIDESTRDDVDDPPSA